MNKIIVTGSKGFLGNALVKRLKEESYDIFLTTRNQGDITSEYFWKELPKADFLVHLAARTHVPTSWNNPNEFIHTNTFGTQLALDWCYKNNAKLILASAYIYGIPMNIPISESEKPSPNNPYALSKFLGEKCAVFYSEYFKLDVTVLRIFNIFGAEQNKNFLIPSILNQVLNSDRIEVESLYPKRDYIYINDVVNSIIKSLKYTKGCNIVNIGSGKTHSVSDVISLAQTIGGTSLPVICKNNDRFCEIPITKANIENAKKNLRWEPSYSLYDGLSETLNIIRSQNQNK